MIRAILRNSGIHPKRLLVSAKGWLRYAGERKAFLRMPSANLLHWGRELPMLTEWDESSGALGAYFFQDRLVASWIHERKPTRHVDVGSRLDGFVGNLSVFREVDVIDIRQQPATVPNVRFHQLDLMGNLPDVWKESTDSLSCLHTIEHFGLGRYGDPLDPEGHLKGIAQLKQMVARDGILYLSTPVGEERVEFNAHRVFAPDTMLDWFADAWSIEHTAVIDDQCNTHSGSGPDALVNARCHTGVGIVAARKLG